MPDFDDALASATDWLPVPPTDTPPPADWLIGRFRVERELGRGGMGVVLLARDRDLDRQVAVKLLREDDPETLARFKLEAHALAGLGHPNAVRVFEYGEHAGRPFLALEYVPGRSLHDALRGGPLAPRRAAELIAQVAGAVQAAHDLGIVHRDLKPANVLLGEADTPKLTDFGVARRIAGGSGLTATNVALGTPGYMPPEQASGHAPDARTDVYGLGATLYECLTGRPPFVGPTAAVLHQVMTADPVPPRRLNAAVPVDLETVCLKCLEKEPGRRYATAADLADDLRRVVRGEPILARATGPVGRAVRWTRRNRRSAFLLAVAVLSLVGGAGAAGWQAVRATAARDAEAAQRQVAEAKTAEAEAERENARAEQRRAEGLADEAAVLNRFLVDDLLKQASGHAQADARFKPDPGLTVRAALDRAAGRAGERFKDHPAHEELVRLALSEAYQGLGDYVKAADQCERVLASRRGRLGPTDQKTLTALNNLAVAYKNGGRTADALPLHEEVHRLTRAALGPAHARTLAAANNLAMAYRHADRLAEAVPLFEDCLRGLREASGPTHPQTLMVLSNLADAYGAAGRVAEGLAANEEAVRLKRAALGPDHPQTLVSADNLGAAYRAAGRAAEAVPLHEDCLRRRRALLGPDHPETLFSLHNLAAAYESSGRRAEAVPLYEDCLGRRRAKLGPAHPQTLSTAANLAAVHLRAGRPADAVPLCEDVWRARAGRVPADPAAPAARGRLADALTRAGRYADAEPHLLALHAAGGDGAADRRRQLADLYEKWGKPAEAAKWRPEVAPPPRPAGVS